jgi:hypothetical protein
VSRNIPLLGARKDKALEPDAEELEAPELVKESVIEESDDDTESSDGLAAESVINGRCAAAVIVIAST